MVPLSRATRERAAILFEGEAEAACAELERECAENLPMQEHATPESLERIRFAALKSSGGTLAGLAAAIRLAKTDWRDLLVEADFADDVHAHLAWTPVRRAVDIIVRALEEDPTVLVCLVGQTASGKTALATEVAARVGGEIVTADSVQIYREFDIGSGKPSAAEMASAPHHLVSALDPMAPCDAFRFVTLADAVITSVRERGRVPIVCGGTFLWVKALVQGLVPAPAASEPVREAHRKIVETSGRNALHAALAKVDAASAAKLHPNDVVRVSRALEVFETTGKKMSDLHASHGFSEARHKAKLFAIDCTTEDLRARIEKRVDAFIAAGWIDEVRGLIARGRADARAMSSVGYREVAAHLRGEIDATDLKVAIVRSTRVFARRQRTWLGHEPVTWLPPQR